MKYSDTYREQLLLDAVRSAEDAAIQLRQYAAAVLAVHGEVSRLSDVRKALVLQLCEILVGLLQ